MFLKLAAKLFEPITDAIGHHNPQLLREWQGRLRWRNLIFVGVLSLIVQGLVILQRLAQLPTKAKGYSHYCLHIVESSGQCKPGANGLPLIEWTVVWAELFRDLSVVMVWVLIVGGVYILAADISKENRRGTLNFLRMSPLSGRRILTGKVLGVPVLLYLGIAALLPLHIATGLMGSYSLTHFLMFYGLLGAIALCFYASALWFTLLTKGLQGFQTWLITGISLGLLALARAQNHANIFIDWVHYLDPMNSLISWPIQRVSREPFFPFAQGLSSQGFSRLGWFYLRIGSHNSWFLLFALVNAIVLGLWFWTLLERKFQTPANTAIGKQQSYGLTLYLSLMTMGLSLQEFPTEKDLWRTDITSYIVAMTIVGVVLMFLLLPAKQHLLDWARYRHQQSRRKNSFIKDLLFHDGSPLPLALAANLCLMAGVLLLGIGIHNAVLPLQTETDLLKSWILISALLVVCSLAIQWIALSNLLHWRWTIFGTASAILLGWPIMLGISGVSQYHGTFTPLWLTTVYAPAVVGGSYASEIGIAIAIHIILISTLSCFLIRRCKILGQSEWKMLMESRSHPPRSQA